MVHVALTGLGFMGKMHLSIYGQLEGVEVVAFCDANADNLSLKEGQAGNIAIEGGLGDFSDVKRFSDYGEMLEWGEFDFVDLCLPTQLHRDFTIQALEAGFHVFCEKPMARSFDEAKEMMAAAKSTGKYLTIGQCLRFWPVYVEMGKIIAEKTYGEVISAELARYSQTPTWSTDNWIMNPANSGNAALDLHVHDVDMILNWFGRPQGVLSSGAAGKDGSFGHIASIYDYPGKSVTSVGNWVCSDCFGLTMRALVVLEKAVLEMDSSKQPLLTIHPQGGKRIAVDLDSNDGYYYELKDFVECVASGKAPSVVTPETAAESLEVVLAEIESARNEVKVRL